jgi:hypothetical protein
MGMSYYIDMSEGKEKIVVFWSKKYVDELPSVGFGRRLFEQIDEYQADEEISPQLAEAMRKTLATKEKGDPGTLERLAIMGGPKHAVGQLESMLMSAAAAMENHKEGNRGEIISEWSGWQTK